MPGRRLPLPPRADPRRRVRRDAEGGPRGAARALAACWSAQRRRVEEIVGYHLEQAYRYQGELGVVDAARRARGARRRAARAAGRSAPARGHARCGETAAPRPAAALPEHGSRLELLRELSTALWLDGERGRRRVALSESIDVARRHGEHARRVVRPPRARGASNAAATRGGCARHDGGTRDRRSSPSSATTSASRAPGGGSGSSVHGAPVRRHRGGQRGGRSRMRSRVGTSRSVRASPTSWHGAAVRTGACRRGDRPCRDHPRVRRTATCSHAHGRRRSRVSSRCGASSSGHESSTPGGRPSTRSWGYDCHGSAGRKSSPRLSYSPETQAKRSARCATGVRASARPHRARQPAHLPCRDARVRARKHGDTAAARPFARICETFDGTLRLRHCGAFAGRSGATHVRHGRGRAACA